MHALLRYMSFGVLAATMLFTSYVAVAQESPLTVQLETYLENTDSDELKAVEPDSELAPGDILVYRAIYKNVSLNPLVGFQATLPVPVGTQATLQKTSLPAPLASIDGKTFLPVPIQRPTTNKSVKETVLPREYAALRWPVEMLAPGEKFTAEVRVRVLDK